MNTTTLKTIIYNSFLVCVVVFALLFLTQIAFAQQVNLIEPLPGGGNLTRGSGLLTQYLGLVFRLTLSAAAILALLFIVLGGVRYTLTAVSPSEKGAAKDMIFNAIWGLLIVLLAYLILYTINQDLVRFNFGLPTVATTAPAPGAPPGTGVPPGTPGTIPNATQEQANINLLTNSCNLQTSGASCTAGSANCNCIGINNPPCPVGSTGQGCTSVGGLQQNTINGVIAINQQCNTTANCNIVITGGNEPGHACCAHANGQKVDLRTSAQVDNYILNNTTQTGTITLSSGQQVAVRQGTLPNGQQIRVIDERSTGAPHWDVEFL